MFGDSASSYLIKRRKKDRERERKTEIAPLHPHKYRNRIILTSFTPLTTPLWIFPPFHQNHLISSHFFLFATPPFLLWSLPLLPISHLCHFTPHFLHLSIFLQTISQSWLLFSCYGDRGIEGLKMASSFSPLLFSGCPGPCFHHDERLWSSFEERDVHEVNHYMQNSKKFLFADFWALPV